MTEYNKQESLNRILRVLEGHTETNGAPNIGLDGSLFSETEALTRIAQLLGNQLLGEALHLPVAIEHDYGGIYTWTGTSTLTNMTSSAYTKITGSFQNSMYADGITAQPTLDRLLLSQTGMYFVSWSLSYIGSSAINYKVEPYHAALGTPQAAAESTPTSSGTVTSMSGSGIFIASGTAELVDLRLLPSATAWMVPVVMQMTVQRIGSYA